MFSRDWKELGKEEGRRVCWGGWLWEMWFGGRMGKMGEGGGGRRRILGIGVPQGPLFALLFCFL